MIRTGWWTGWDKFCNENGQPYDRTLRTLEAFLMTARKNGLPVQFNFFAFLPEVLGGTNPYLDPEAVRKQRTLITSVVNRFHDVPGSLGISSTSPASPNICGPCVPMATPSSSQNGMSG